MKKIFFLLLITLCVNEVFAQIPQQMNYQGVARNNFGNAIANQSVRVRLTVRDLTATGTALYTETRAVTTNLFGLFNIVINSTGATGVTGSFTTIPWATGAKFIQVEIDPTGGTSFINAGTTQLQAVPYSLFAASAIPAGPAGGSLTGTYPNPTVASGAITATMMAPGVIPTTLPPNGPAGGSLTGTYPNPTLGTGVVTSTNIAAGVIPTTLPPSGAAGGDLTGTYPNPTIAPLAVTTPKIADGSVTSVKITVPLVKVQGDANALLDITNSGAGAGISGTNTGNGFGGLFQVNNAASTSDGLRATTNGTGASWAIRGVSSGTNGAGLFQQTNATNTSNNLQSNQAGLGRAGLFNSTNATSTANAVDINVAGTGFALRAASSNAIPRALQTVGGVQLTGIGELAGRVLTTDASGNATWQNVSAAAGTVSGSGTLNFVPKWTPSGSALGNSLLFDNGTSIGIGTTTPTHRLDITHSGSTGLGINSTAGFSVLDINAVSGDAAIRFANNGVNQWNLRNEPGTDNLQVFELGGGGERLSIKDATGNIAIGAADGSYRLDVLHGGSTGIRNRSSSSFSVIDIDAKSGDAALRFAKDGVNQWNVRNRPGDDYFEIFELGGGGSRVVIQDATGNVGIGETTAPSYKLDVLHGGSTGIRSRSSASFSVVDIDAKSGDAALRFVKDGVNQWNIRNEPGTDDLQVFELGGGGERLSIKDATGNIAVGGADGSYRLDVLHGGATGIRSRSAASFSVVDIDAKSGDAALRFVKDGVNQWNTRNNPGTDDYQIFELGGGGERMRIENTTGRVVVNGNFTALGVKAFTMDHPLDPANKTLMHAAIESNEVLNSYSGTITTDANGKALVTLPDYFEAINKDYRYQLTVMGTFAQAIISKEVSNNKFEIATNQPNVKVSWEVKGVRNDAHMRKFPFKAEEEKTAVQKGHYYDPSAYNQPESSRVSYANVGESSLDDVKPAATKKVTSPTSGGSLDDAPKAPAKKTVAEPEESSIKEVNKVNTKAKTTNTKTTTTKSSID